MLIKLKLTIHEMDEAYYTINKIRKKNGDKPIDILFEQKDIDMKSVKINQRLTETYIDIDEPFVLWILNKLVRVYYVVKPIKEFLKSLFKGYRRFINKPKITNKVSDIPGDIDKEFNV